MTRQIEDEMSSFTYAEQIFARRRLNGPGEGELESLCDALSWRHKRSSASRSPAMGR